jgi:hypothetical protein
VIYLVVLFDIVDSGHNGRTLKDWRALRSALTACITSASKVAGIPWSALTTEDTGDGMRLIVPSSVDWKLFTGPFLDALFEELNRHNATHAVMERFQLRTAFDGGDLDEHEGKMDGFVLISITRLVNAEPLRKALEATRATLGVVASDFIYRDVIRHSDEGRHTEYRAVYYEEKESKGYLWMRIPGMDAPIE